MSAPIILVCGTGTSVGKTHVAASLVLAWSRRGRRVAGLKPVETGGTDDADLLGRMSTFHVKRRASPYMLARPVSPHLAARLEGRSVDPSIVLEWLSPYRQAADGIVLELAGGLFTPLAMGITNAELARWVAADAILLVAPDRLGVLHDVAAVTRAARDLAIKGIVLSTCAVPDASTGSNGAELAVVTDVPVLGVFPRAAVEDLVAPADLVLTRLLAPAP